MLGHALYSSACFGFPLEYLQANNLKRWSELLNTSTTLDTLQAVMERRTAPNGVFGIKLHFSHLSQFASFSQLLEVFPNPYFVLLSRKNALQQAVSYAIAQQTGVWIDGQAPVKQKAQYSYEQIEQCFKSILRDNASWRYSLLAHQCNFIELDFDNVKKEIPACIRQIAQFAEVDLTSVSLPGQPVTRAQSREINLEWEKRFYQDYRGGNLFAVRTPGFLARARQKLKRLMGE